jgi:hypothetical protein
MFHGLGSKQAYVQTIDLFYYKIGILIPILILIFVLMEWLGRESQYALSWFGRKLNAPFRWALYYIILFIIYFYAGSEQQFIYFQF